MSIEMIKNILETYLAPMDKDPRVKAMIKLLELVLSQLLLMDCFVEDLLSYNMIQEGAFKLNPKVFDPKDVLKFIQDTFSPKSVSRKVMIATGFLKSCKLLKTRLFKQ